MRRAAPPSLLLLLMAGLALAAASACEADASCPPQCPRATQCLHYLQESHTEEVCGGTPERRRDQLRGLRMRHCCERAVEGALPEEAFRDAPACRRHLDALVEVDRLAGRLSCAHAELLTRYDCAQNYSIAHDCADCKGAYRRWVCSSLVPHYSRSGQRVRPCLSVCEDVEQQCPYLVPDQTISPGEAAHPTPQYGGEPAFLCLDPNIPETGQQRLRSSRGGEDCCYTHCGSPGRGSQPDVDGSRRPRPEILDVCRKCTEQPARPHRGCAGARTFDGALLVCAAWVTLAHSVQTEGLMCFLLVVCEECVASVRTALFRFFKGGHRHRCS